MEGADLINEGLNKELGFVFEELSPDRVVLTWTAAPEHLQPYGLVHGGVYCAAVEASASVGAGLWFGERGRVVGVNNNTNFLRSAREGDRLVATATPLHRGRSQQLWQVEIRSDDELVARGEVRLQNLTL